MNVCGLGSAAYAAQWALRAGSLVNGVVSGLGKLAEGDWLGGAADLFDAGASGYMMTKACFAAGTRLLTRRGWVPIEQIDERDEVWSKPEGEANHPGGWKAVEETFERLGRVWLLRVRGQEIRTTGEHPFYVVDRGWIEAANLAAGDVLLTKEGGYVGVESCEDTGEFEVVYNLRVADWHTYFVGDEGWDWGVWSHNSSCVNPEALRRITGVTANQGKVALRYLKSSEEKAVKYLTDPKRGVSEKVAREAIAATKVAGASPTTDQTYAHPGGKYRKGVREKVWDNAVKEGGGIVKDPVTGKVINKDDPWEMGHKPKMEFRKHQADAKRRGINREQFLVEHNDPRRYRPEIHASNIGHYGDGKTSAYASPL